MSKTSLFLFILSIFSASHSQAQWPKPGGCGNSQTISTGGGQSSGFYSSGAIPSSTQALSAPQGFSGAQGSSGSGSLPADQGFSGAHALPGAQGSSGAPGSSEAPGSHGAHEITAPANPNQLGEQPSNGQVQYNAVFKHSDGNQYVWLQPLQAGGQPELHPYTENDQNPTTAIQPVPPGIPMPGQANAGGAGCGYNGGEATSFNNLNNDVGKATSWFKNPTGNNNYDENYYSNRTINNRQNRTNRRFNRRRARRRRLFR